MRGHCAAWCVFIALIALGGAEAQLIVEDFDSLNSGATPTWPWWHNGPSGTALVDETVALGGSGRSVKLTRTAFDGRVFGIGRNFRPLSTKADLSYFLRVEATDQELLTVVGGNNAAHQVAWWVGVGGAVGHAIGTYSEAGGWNHVMDVAVDTWYGVTLEIDPASSSYDITVWEDGNPSNTATETGVPFSSGSAVDTIDQIQFGNFSGTAVTATTSAYVDEVRFEGGRILVDDFETGNTSGWTRSTRPLTTVTTCGQVVTTDAVLADDLDCSALSPGAVAVILDASNITFNLAGHALLGTSAIIAIAATDVDAVSVKDGEITDFGSGIDLNDTNTATVSDLAISNLVEDDPDCFVEGMRITRSQDVQVRDSFFEFLRVAHKASIVSAGSGVNIDNIEVNNASLGVHISGDPGSGNVGSVVYLRNSRLVGVTIAGVLVNWTAGSWVEDNEFDHNEVGVCGDLTAPDGITGLVVDNNAMSHNSIGVHFMGNGDCSVLNNIVNGGWRGIYLDSQMGYPDTGYDPSCIYATGNLVSGNLVTGNYRDLVHHESALGNTWTDNLCQTKEGSEIPQCTLK